jgi:signal peptide peptidase SppA
MKLFFKKLMFWKSRVPRVAMVRLAGVIAAGGSPLKRGLNLDSIDPVLKKAFGMRRIQAVILVINSPGGSPVQSALIGARIRQLAKKHDVPVLAFCEDVAASGGYWLATSADEIYANDASVIGSIGVISAGFGFPRTLEKLGVERRVYTSGKSKSMLDPFRPEKKEDVQHLEALQSDIHQTFINQVKTRRGSRLDSPEDELFSGQFWTGVKARELGLVDGLGAMHDVLSERFGNELEIVAIQPKRQFLSFAGPAGEAVGRAGADYLAVHLEERSYWQRFGL